MLGAHFKILSGNGKNPFEKQKVWGKGTNKNKDEYKNPVVWFMMAIVTDVEPEEVVSCVVHKWHRIGGVQLGQGPTNLQKRDHSCMLQRVHADQQIHTPRGTRRDPHSSPGKSTRDRSN